MRVAQVVCGDGFAGVERYVAALGRELARRGVDSVVVGGNEALMAGELSGGDVEWLPGGNMAEAAWSLTRAHVDLVNAHMTQAELVALVVSGRRRTPVVSTRHFAADRGSTRTARSASVLVERRLSAQIAISDFVAEHVREDTEVILSGVPATSDTVLAVDRERTVLVAQRLESEKETRVALDAWGRCATRRRGWRLRIAGTGTLDRSLRSHAEALGITDTVDFLGRRGDVPALMRRASLLLATAPSEPLGLTVIEAMSHALPTVATGSGGHLESLGDLGKRWSFPPGDAVRAAELVDALAADPGARDALGRDLQSRQRERLTLRRQAERTLDLYRRVIG